MPGDLNLSNSAVSKSRLASLTITIQNHALSRLLSFLSADLSDLSLAQKISTLEVAARLLKLGGAGEFKALLPSSEVEGTLDVSWPPSPVGQLVHRSAALGKDLHPSQEGQTARPVQRRP